MLYTEDPVEDCQRAALVGLGGVGKTQIALELAFQIQKLSPECSVFWVRASDATSFESSYREIGQQLKIPGLNEDKADVKELVRAKLSQESAGKWILIVDNADDLELLYDKADESSGSHALHDYLPFSFNGAILFTTRDRKAASKYADPNVIFIEEMDDIESRELLKRSLQNKRLVEDEDSTTKLLKLLLNLPLAIMQAAAFLNAQDATIAEYLRIYVKSSDDVINLLSEDFEDRRRYSDVKNPVATTWLISFEQIRHRDRLAAYYMAFMSCINDQDIPRDLLQKTKAIDPLTTQLQKTKAIGTLKAFGFIKERNGRESYDMHRLVHIAMQNWLKLNNEWMLWKEKTLEEITDAFPWPEHKNRAVWTMYLPHALCIITSTKVDRRLEELRSRVLHNVGECFLITGKYTEAKKMLQQTLQLKEKVLGTEHPSTLHSMNNLAVVLDNQGKYVEAEQMHRQTLQLREKVLGAEHPDTLVSMNNLASVLGDQGKYAEAEQMHRQTLQLREKLLGTEHLDTLHSMYNLASVLNSQGKYAEAEQMHRQTLQLREKLLGTEHPSMLHSMNNLALVLNNQGKYAEAEQMHRQTLQLREKVLGAEHPDTLMGMNNLALVLDNQGKYAEAEQMHRQTLQLKEKVLGTEYPTTLNSMNNLAVVLDNQGKYAEAEQMHRQTLQLREKVLGAEHPDTLISMNNLALLLKSQGKQMDGAKG
jgi:Tfp pilus assembly protein PilF